jgi:ADP-ribose pyrophosphatase
MSMSANKLRATIKSSTPVASGFLRVTRYEFETDKHAGGSQTVVREVMERGNAIAVLAYDPKRDVVVLVNEFRPGCLLAGDDAFTDNLAAGGIADNETAIEAAVRETKEETGLDLVQPILVHPGAYVSSGGTSEKIAIVAGMVDASNAGGIHGVEGESEDILCVVVPADEFIRRARNSEIADLKTLVAAYWFADNRERLRRQGM